MELIKFENYINDFVWDFSIHFPVPTISYVLKRTGIDLMNRFDTSERIEGFLISISRTAKNYAFRGKIFNDRMNTEYLIAHNLEVLYETLEYICEFIQVAMTSGDYMRLFEINDNKIKIPAIENAYNNLSYNRRIHFFYTPKYREGY